MAMQPALSACCLLSTQQSVDWQWLQPCCQLMCICSAQPVRFGFASMHPGALPASHCVHCILCHAVNHVVLSGLQDTLHSCQYLPCLMMLLKDCDCLFQYCDHIVQAYVALCASILAFVNNTVVCRFAHTQSEWWVSFPRGYPMLQSAGGTPPGASPGWARSSHTPSSSASLTCWRAFPLPRHWL